jgi:signal transduction histidine kinase
MAPQSKRAFLRLSVVGFLAAVLVLLAVLQYRWSLEISRAERTRIEASLNTSMNQFRQEFYRELAQVTTAFHSDPTAEPGDFWPPYAERYQAWVRTATRPDLVANVYVSEAGGPADAQLLLLRPAEDRFDSVEWPASLADLRTRLADESRQPQGQAQGPGGDLAGGPAGSPPAPEMRSSVWTLEERIPALVHPVFNFSRPRGGGPRWSRHGGRAADGPRISPPPPPRVILGFVIVELNRAVLDRLLGELAQRYFAGPDGFIYNVAVVSGTPERSVIYRSDPQLTAASLTPPDARAALAPGTAREDRPAGASYLEATPPRRASRKGTDRGAFLPRPRGSPILPSASEEPWQLMARHKGGSLEAVVAADRRRNLLLSFGVLLVLAVSMALVMVSAQRARRLARLQMEFVAGVSHELRTPVAVICSAADNLAEGFVGARDQVKEYGSLIRNEGRRLAGMIEQILHFAAGQSRRATYDLKPVGVSDAIDASFADISALPEAAGFTMEREIEPDLPPVEADAAALTRCLENLVLNALKYGGDRRWVRVRACQATGDAARVRISVEDRGEGIDPADLPHIFEPFYRGKAAQAAQIHGTGLGLSLARDMAEGMGGRLEAASEIGRGSTFTLELPAAAAVRAGSLPHPVHTA